MSDEELSGTGRPVGDGAPNVKAIVDRAMDSHGDLKDRERMTES